jgi:tRNA dimethylallyltransferase
VKPLVAIVGETASGKSALALELAERFNGEIVCADSSTVYRGFDIGTAKPGQEDQQRVPHHLLDVADPWAGCSAAIFQRLAYAAIEDITARGKLPFLVGGSGLYIDSVLYNYKFLPPPSVERRRELNNLSLHELLQETERLGLSTEAVDVNNKRRVIRWIENNGCLPDRQALRSHTLVLGLQIPRAILQANVERRIDVMLEADLEQEVHQLVNKYGWEVEPMKAISYREWFGYFEGRDSLAKTCQGIIHSNMMLAKKQRTWFKRNSSIHWLSTDDKFTKSVELITTLLNT